MDSVGHDYYLVFIQSHIVLADLVGNIADTSLLTAKQLKIGKWNDAPCALKSLINCEGKRFHRDADIIKYQDNALTWIVGL